MYRCTLSLGPLGTFTTPEAARLKAGVVQRNGPKNRTSGWCPSSLFSPAAAAAPRDSIEMDIYQVALSSASGQTPFSPTFSRLSGCQTPNRPRPASHSARTNPSKKTKRFGTRPAPWPLAGTTSDSQDRLHSGRGPSGGLGWPFDQRQTMLLFFIFLFCPECECVECDEKDFFNVCRAISPARKDPIEENLTDRLPTGTQRQN